KKYIHILNTRSAFEALRKLRHQQRSNLLSPSGTLLLKGLDLYARNGEHYMSLLEKIISQNQLGQYD
ncbi:MAG: glucosaminidase, partial [Gammaproteobacteria bacterium]|nr:glucosaminidase [Gammaproteobacteria bacterium]